MEFARGEVAHRARWVAVFTFLLLAISAVPVFADSTGPEQFPAPDGAPASVFPNGQQVAEGLREAEAEEAAAEAQLGSSQAIAEREESVEAFADISASEARALLKAQFPEELAAVEQDSARMLSDVSIDAVLSPTSARITVDGEPRLMEGTLPIRATEDDGDLKKVNLDLVAGDTGFEQVNPLTEVTLAESAAGGVSIGDEGLSIEPQLTEGATTGQRFGDKDVFYPETQTDTDTLAMPIANGVELFSQLRSIESPEQLRFHFDLPEGAVLTMDGEGNAEVARDAIVLARIPAPTAIDAQGADVPVQMEVDGASLVLHVAHREMDLAYPLLVDPIAEDWNAAGSWHAGGNLAALSNGTWAFNTNDWGRFWWYISSPVPGLVGGSEKGLFARANGTSNTQPAEHFAEYSYTAPGSTTFITDVGINPLWRFNYGCGSKSYPEPHDYVGLWSHTWGWTVPVQIDPAAATYAIVTAPRNDWHFGIGQVLIVGLGTGASTSPATPCTRDLYLGGAYVWLDDWENPTLGQVTGAPSGWVTEATPFTINVNSSDAGLGVRAVTIWPAGENIIKDVVGNCTGLRASPCPASRNSSFNLTGTSFGQGQTTSTVAVEDPAGKVSPVPYTFETKVDRTPPEVILSGQLAEATKEMGSTEVPAGQGDELSLPVYNLNIAATDGSLTPNSAKRSGIKKIEVLLDGTKKQEWEQSCPGSSCGMTKTYELKLDGLAAGKHVLKVIATDYVSKKREREIEFEYFPATGMKDEYMMHYFPLPDGQGNEAEEEHPDRPELAVNVMNGNLVYREKDVEVDGAGVDLEVERYYNSMLPTAQNTEWGDGWTLAQTPELEPKDTGGTPAPDEAELVDSSGVIEDGVDLPSEVGGKDFDPVLQATITKEASGYEFADESGETDAAIAFDQNGRTEELRTGGYAKVDYEYEGGSLAEIAVEDPASATDPSPAPSPTPTYSSSFGTSGTGNGQLNAPADVAIDSLGNLWVVDRTNNRIQKFNAQGEYVSKFGATGSGNGQFNRPTSIAVDASNNLWVVDANNNRIQKFNANGAFLSKVGSYGSGNGQFSAPEGIAIDDKGNIWVADTLNGRLQKFNSAGLFIKAIGSKGSGPGQFGEANSLDIGPSNNVWVADWVNNRVTRFNEAGEFVTQFGSAGSGNGQFNHPDAIEVDGKGNLWVGDQSNNRVQLFSLAGKYIAKFGSTGSGAGQFSFTYPMGIATDGKGSIWITDANNNRVQKWLQAQPVQDNDPSVELSVVSGLISGLDGEDAGTHSYAHAGDDLTSHNGPEGETKYKYDAAGRMTEVTLPNGTYAKIAYNSTYGRVSSVTVDPAGAEPAKTASFSYSDQPRRTTVTPPGKPVVTYDIGADGSVLKWWNAIKPPEFKDFAGSLVANKETANPITNGDHSLVVEGHSAEGIVSIQVIANGNQLVKEKTCPNPEKAATECVNLVTEWVTNTSNHPPGILNLEAVITDRLGQIESRRFWVNIPQPPPPPAPGSPVAPTFQGILDFREEFGLDIVDPVIDELERNDRIFDLIGAWSTGDPVARSTMDRWGVPLRTKDVEELEYRDRYMAQAAATFQQWADTNAPTTYAGYYVDHREGGIVHVGFTANQAMQLESLKSAVNPMAPSRLAVFSTTPTRSLASLNALRDSVSSVALSQNMWGPITSLGVDEKTNTVRVGASDVGQVNSFLSSAFGGSAGFFVFHDTYNAYLGSRFITEGRIRAGDHIASEKVETCPSNPTGCRQRCTAAFGAWENRGSKPNGDPNKVPFLLTAGHCYDQNERVVRQPAIKSLDAERIGEVTRTAWNSTSWPADGEAVRLEGGYLVPQKIYRRDGQGGLQAVNGVEVGQKNTFVCHSGVASDRMRCGYIEQAFEEKYIEEEDKLTVAVPMSEGLAKGDSGAPVWNPLTGNVLGIAAYGNQDLLWYAPLKTPAGASTAKAPGLLSQLGNLATLQIDTDR